MPYEMLRKRQLLLSGVSLVCCTSLLLLSCDSVYKTQAEPTVAASVKPSLPGQVLPVTATAKIANQFFDLEVAKSRPQQSIGLMYRTFLPSNRGMLFPFNPPQAVQFWMKNCRLSLDMIFLHQGKVIAIAANTPPCKSDPCPVYGPNELTDQVIELRGGVAASIGLKVGAMIEVQPLKIPR
jgi:uncharacterized protein